MRTKSTKPQSLIDEEILLAAEAILQKRLERQGAIAEPSDAGRYLRARIAHSDREIFGCLFLDTRHRIIACEDIFFGTIDGAEVHPREVLRRALQLNAAAIVCFHNHPSGCTDASAADRSCTQRLKAALALVDIRLLDHIIVGSSGFQSMASRGWV